MNEIIDCDVVTCSFYNEWQLCKRAMFEAIDKTEDGYPLFKCLRYMKRLPEKKLTDRNERSASYERGK